MYPQQQPVQPQQPSNLDFTAQPQQQPVQPTAPVAPPAPDPAITQLQTDIGEIKTALGSLVPQAPMQQPEPVQEPQKKYDEWGAVFEDVDKRAEAIVDARLTALQQEQTQTNDQVQQQEQQNQQYIDNTLNQLRQSGYLPPVTNQFDNNDLGKQAENELLAYTISLGSTDLAQAAQELKFRHDTGYKYDYQTKQFIQQNQPSNNPNDQMFGNLPQIPDQRQPQPFPPNQPIYPQQPQQAVGPQNPYAPQQYPAGFNAPVSSGNSYQGTQGSTPALKNLRANSYDALVDQFNRSQ